MSIHIEEVVSNIQSLPRFGIALAAKSKIVAYAYLVISSGVRFLPFLKHYHCHDKRKTNSSSNMGSAISNTTLHAGLLGNVSSLLWFQRTQNLTNPNCAKLRPISIRWNKTLQGWNVLNIHADVLTNTRKCRENQKTNIRTHEYSHPFCKNILV